MRVVADLAQGNAATLTVGVVHELDLTSGGFSVAGLGYAGRRLPFPFKVPDEVRSLPRQKELRMIPDVRSWHLL